MRVLRLASSGGMYTSNAYLVLGSWSRIADVNTLVDVGRDPYILHALAKAPTGVGKRRVEQIVITHSHYDHSELLPLIKDNFAAPVLAMSSALEGVDKLLADGDIVRMGDEQFEIFQVHAHSQDSICLYNANTGTLFSGDAPLLLNANPGQFDPGFACMIERLCRLKVEVIYPGHGEAVTGDCQARLRRSLALLAGEGDAGDASGERILS